VKEEMETFTTFTGLRSFRNQYASILTDSELQDAMKSFCPTVIKMFYGMFLQCPDDIYQARIHLNAKIVAVQQTKAFGMATAEQLTDEN
jgi:hypothetical protein